MKAAENNRIHLAGASRRKLALVLMMLTAGFFVYLITVDRVAGTPSGDIVAAEPGAEEQSTEGDYSKFPHSNQMHSRLPCLLCHKREDNSPRPKRSAHLPCAGCHMQQFAQNEGNICTICHTDSKGPELKPFPPLRSFNVKFNHGLHVRQTGCATCHQPSRRGVALSVPSGAKAHVTCYQCHGPQTKIGERNIGSCGVCHEQGRPTRATDWAKAFQLNFSHAKHTKTMGCAECHEIRPGSARGRQVTEPLASMHFAPKNVKSCASCHNTSMAFGETFSDCKRCHTGDNFKFR